MHFLFREDKRRLSTLLLIASVATHFSVVVIVVILYLKGITSYLKERIYLVLKTSKIRMSYLMPIFLIPVIIIIFGAVVNKLIFLFTITGNVEFESKITKILVIIYCCCVIFYQSKEPMNTQKCVNYLLLMSPILLNISLARIAWLYAYSLYMYPMAYSNSNIKSRRLYLISLLPLSIFYLIRGLNSVINADLMF